MMNVNEFLEKLKTTLTVKTLYVMGGWGFPLNDANKERTQKNSYNRREERKKLIDNASSDTFAFDCCGLCKAIMWGWCGDVNAKNGGAVYASNGFPDYDAKEIMLNLTTEQSTDFSKVDPGEFLWLDGHCGIYLGDGLAIESTPAWKDGVQITVVRNVCKEAVSAYPFRTWTYHGHLKNIDYSSKYPQTPFIAHNTLKGVLIRDIPYSDGKGIGYIILGSDVQIEKLSGSSGDYGKITGYVYLPGGFET